MLAVKRLLLGFCFFLFSFAAALSVASCRKSAPANFPPASSENTPQGSLSIELADLASPELESVYVTISEIQIRADDGEPWQSVLSGGGSYDLMHLINGVRASLGEVPVAAGPYTELKLTFGAQPDGGFNVFNEMHPFANYVVTRSGVVHELRAAVGENSVTIEREFDVAPNGATGIVINFNSASSVAAISGNEGYLFVPDVKIVEAAIAATVGGAVSVNGSQAPVIGASVTAQVYDPAASDQADDVTIEASTVTDATGRFSLFLTPGTYNIVAVREGFAAAAARVEVGARDFLMQDFALSAAQTRKVSGAVAVPDANGGAHVFISVRHEIVLGNFPELIEIWSAHLAGRMEFLAMLPEGNYEIVVSTEGKETLASALDLTTDAATRAEISF